MQFGLIARSALFAVYFEILTIIQRQTTQLTTTVLANQPLFKTGKKNNMHANFALTILHIRTV